MNNTIEICLRINLNKINYSFVKIKNNKIIFKFNFKKNDYILNFLLINKLKFSDFFSAFPNH